MIAVLAGEERDEENFKKIAARISAKYGDYFYKLLITIHPKNTPGGSGGQGGQYSLGGTSSARIH